MLEKILLTLRLSNLLVVVKLTGYDPRGNYLSGILVCCSSRDEDGCVDIQNVCFSYSMEPNNII